MINPNPTVNNFLHSRKGKVNQEIEKTLILEQRLQVASHVISLLQKINSELEREANRWNEP